jgi:N-acetylglucosamine-6-phosphate deacetylase
MEWIAADHVFDGKRLLAKHAIGIADHRVTDVRPTSDLQAHQITGQHSGILTPGFLDIQVNGGGGVLLNTQPTQAGMRTIINAHRQFGTTALMPTVITDAPDILALAVDAAIAAKDEPGFMGLHIEGPHLSTARRGTHAAHHVRPFSADTLALVYKLRESQVPTLITVAPEAISAQDVAKLNETGTIVSLGHSDATADEAMALVAAGATCFTHLFNAMSPMLNRAPGVTGAAIASDVYCSIIADGIHVDPMMVALAIRARPKANRMIAVSDAMSTVGGPDRFTLYGQDIHLNDGRLVNAEGSLAGAHLTLIEALQNLVSYGITLETAFQMCRTNPFALLGMESQADLIGQQSIDVVMLAPDLKLQSVGLQLPNTTSQAV